MPHNQRQTDLNRNAKVTDISDRFANAANVINSAKTRMVLS